MSLLVASDAVISRSIASTTALALSAGTLMLSKASYREYSAVTSSVLIVVAVLVILAIAFAV